MNADSDKIRTVIGQLASAFQHVAEELTGVEVAFVIVLAPANQRNVEVIYASNVPRKESISLLEQTAQDVRNTLP